MPSSSDQQTFQERRLSYWYKLTWARLHHSGLHKHAQQLSYMYCDVLECTQKELNRELVSDRKYYDDLKEYCLKKSRSDNLWVAADCMADAAACLFSFGRKDDGAWFCEAAEELRGMADKEYRIEQERKEEGHHRR